MPLRILLFFIFIFGIQTVQAQNNYEISFDFENYDNDTLLLAYFYADRQLIKDTVIADQDHKFVYSGNDTLEAGVYILMFFPDKQYIQFLVNDEEKFFSIKGDYLDLARPAFSGSEDNELFYGYMDYLRGLRIAADRLHSERKDAVVMGKDTSKFDRELEEMDELVLIKQNQLIADYPNFMTSVLILGNRDIDMPEFEGEGDDLQMRRFYYYRDHYFDHINLGDPRVLKTPYLDNKLNRYLDNLIVQIPDSVIVAVDYLLGEMEPSIETWKFYVAQFLNKYAKSQIIGMDAVYVHLVDNYYATGRTPWADEETLAKILDNADKLRHVLLGKVAPDITLFTEDNQPVRLHEVESKYTVLVFWAPDCGHCKKSMGEIVAFNEKFKDKGVKTVAVCTKAMEKTASCWEFIKDKGMDGLQYNLADQYHRSRFQVKYNIRTTPKIFILNKDKEIILKRLASEKLEDAMTDILKMDKEREIK